MCSHMSFAVGKSRVWTSTFPMPHAINRTEVFDLPMRKASSSLVKVEACAGSVVSPQISEADTEAARLRLEKQISQSPEGNVLLLCKQCRSPVAALRFCTGSSRHFNPHGYLFHIGEFSRAAGAKVVGEAYKADSWFPGYAWRIGMCRQCGTHLGWRYEGAAPPDASTFWGLIWNRLLKSRGPDSPLSSPDSGPQDGF